MQPIEKRDGLRDLEVAVENLENMVVHSLPLKELVPTGNLTRRLLMDITGLVKTEKNQLTSIDLTKMTHIVPTDPAAETTTDGNVKDAASMDAAEHAAARIKLSSEALTNGNEVFLGEYELCDERINERVSYKQVSHPDRMIWFEGGSKMWCVGQRKLKGQRKKSTYSLTAPSTKQLPELIDKSDWQQKIPNEGAFQSGANVSIDSVSATDVAKLRHPPEPEEYAQELIDAIKAPTCRLKVITLDGRRLLPANSSANKLMDLMMAAFNGSDASAPSDKVELMTIHAYTLPIGKARSKDPSFDMREIIGSSLIPVEVPLLIKLVKLHGEVMSVDLSDVQVPDDASTLKHLNELLHGAHALTQQRSKPGGLKLGSDPTFSYAAAKDGDFTKEQLFAADVSGKWLRSKGHGISAKEFFEVGFNQIYDFVTAGYSSKQVADIGRFSHDAIMEAFKLATVQAMAEEGFSLQVIKDKGKFSAKQVKEYADVSSNFRGESEESNDQNEKKRFAKDFTLAKLKAVGYTCKDLKLAGYTCQAMKDDGKYSCKELQAVGFTVQQLCGVQFGAKTLKESGITAAQLKPHLALANLIAKEVGFTHAELKKAGYTVSDFKEQKFKAQALFELGFTLKELKDGGFDISDIKPLINVTDYAKLKEIGFTAKELKQAKFSAADLKKIGYNATQLKEAEFEVTDMSMFELSELKHAAFGVDDLKKAKYGVKPLRDVGFTLRELREGGFVAKTLKNELGIGLNALRDEAGFTLKDLRQAQFTAKELHDEGAQLRALKDAGFAAKELKELAGLGALKEAGFYGKDLEAAGFNKKEIQAAGYRRGRLGIGWEGDPWF